MYAKEPKGMGKEAAGFSSQLLRTVGSLMHAPPKPDYRSLKQQQLKKKKVGLFCDSTFSKTTSTALPPAISNGRGPSDIKRAFLPSLSAAKSLLNDGEAKEAAQDMQTFEESLKIRHGHIPGGQEKVEQIRTFLDGDGVNALCEGGQPMEELGNTQNPLHFSVVNLLPRIFSRILLQHNKIVSHLREMGRGVVLQKLLSKGRQMGIRSVTSRELYFLLGCVVEGLSLREGDAEYLFRFFDWGSQGSVDFKEVLASTSLLFAPPEMLAVVHCRWLMNERPLDDSIILLADVDVMLEGLTSVFGETVKEVPELCGEVRRALTHVMPMHTVPVPTFRMEIGRFPTLKHCLAAVKSDGIIDWPMLFHALSRPAVDHNKSRLERQRELVDTAIAEDRMSCVEGGSESDTSCTVDICHPLFVADKYSQHRAGASR